MGHNNNPIYTRVVSDKLNLENWQKLFSSKVNILKVICIVWQSASLWLLLSSCSDSQLIVREWRREHSAPGAWYWGYEEEPCDWEKPPLWHHNGYKILIVKHTELFKLHDDSVSWQFWDTSTFQNTWMFPKMQDDVQCWCLVPGGTICTQATVQVYTGKLRLGWLTGSGCQDQ